MSRSSLVPSSLSLQHRFFMKHARLSKLALVISTIFSLPLLAHAQDKDDVAALEFLSSEQASEDVIPNNVPSNAETTAAIDKQKQRQQQNASVDLNTLKKNPQLFTVYMNQLIAARNYVAVQKLLPTYRQLPNKDPLLIKFADALLYRSARDFKSAINLYKGMLAEDPSFHPVRLNLAMVLMDDRQYAAAKSQLIKLKGEDLPATVMKTIDQQLMQIKKSEDWKFSISGNYVQDINVNDAPTKQYTSKLGKTVTAKKAHGIELRSSLSKRKNFDKNIYASFRASAYGKVFWDESDYNDYNLSVNLPIGYANSSTDVSVTPFVSQRIYNKDPYSRRIGATFSGSKWVKPKLRLSTSSQVSFENHQQEKHKNRDSQAVYLGANGLYMQSANQYFFGGASHYSNYAKKSSVVTYDTESVNIGWGREWKKGVSTKLSTSYAYKKYDDPARTLGNASLYYTSFDGEVGSRRVDQTASVDVELWKRNFSLLGLTPRLVLEYSNTQSNFGYYDDRAEASGTVVLTKTF